MEETGNFGSTITLADLCRTIDSDEQSRLIFVRVCADRGESGFLASYDCVLNTPDSTFSSHIVSESFGYQCACGSLDCAIKGNACLSLVESFGKLCMPVIDTSVDPKDVTDVARLIDACGNVLVSTKISDIVKELDPMECMSILERAYLDVIDKIDDCLVAPTVCYGLERLSRDDRTTLCNSTNGKYAVMESFAKQDVPIEYDPEFSLDDLVSMFGRPKYCAYVYSKGKRKGQRCGIETKDDQDYCRRCAAKRHIRAGKDNSMSVPAVREPNPTLHVRPFQEDRYIDSTHGFIVELIDGVVCTKSKLANGVEVDLTREDGQLALDIGLSVAKLKF